METTAQINTFRKKVFEHYRKHKRALPWRTTKDPYRILLSEIMSQQTQIERVVLYYKRWLKMWNSIQALANAPRMLVLQQWSGLGYNNRALRLHETAKIIAEEYNGDVIAAIKARKLPGIGAYTAHAVRIFATNEELVTVDTNIRRILMHEFNLKNPSDKTLWQLAARCLPKGKSRIWHNALMDYGALFVTAKRTGIKPKTQQSIFAGSDRQLRGQLLRLLLKEHTATLSFCCRALAQDDKKRIQRLLDALVADKLLVKKRTTYSVAE